MEKAKNTKKKIVSQGRVIDFVPRRNGVSLSKRPLSLGVSKKPRLRVEPKRGLEIDITTRPKVGSATMVKKPSLKSPRAKAANKKASTSVTRDSFVGGFAPQPTKLSAAAAGMTVGEMMKKQRVATRRVVEKFDDEFGLIEESETIQETIGVSTPKKAQSSPFLSSVMVDKRPLGKGGNKNMATQRKSVQPMRRIEPMDVVEPKSRKSSFPLVGLILLTIVIGGAVGAAVYLILFQ